MIGPATSTITRVATDSTWIGGATMIRALRGVVVDIAQDGTYLDFLLTAG
jgi:hypothetical protein